MFINMYILWILEKYPVKKNILKRQPSEWEKVIANEATDKN